MNRTCRRHMNYYARNKGVCEFLRNVDAPRRPLGFRFCPNRPRGFANSFDFSISLLPLQSAQCLLISKHYIADWNVEGFAECGDGIQAGFFQATLKIGDEDGTYSNSLYCPCITVGSESLFIAPNGAVLFQPNGVSLGNTHHACDSQPRRGGRIRRVGHLPPLRG